MLRTWELLETCAALACSILSIIGVWTLLALAATILDITFHPIFSWTAACLVYIAVVSTGYYANSRIMKLVREAI